MGCRVSPRYVLFAGVNGAGKSTLYHSGLWSRNEDDAALPRVNSDEILVRHGWDWADDAAQLRAGKEALELVRSYFSQGVSFNQETTLSGRSIMRNIKLARNLGYKVVVHYVCLEDPLIANERIAYRVSRGGHEIKPEVVKRRYRSSLENLAIAVLLCDELYLFDNTTQLKLVACIEEGRVVELSFPQPYWAQRILSESKV